MAERVVHLTTFKSQVPPNYNGANILNLDCYRVLLFHVQDLNAGEPEEADQTCGYLEAWGDRDEAEMESF